MPLTEQQIRQYARNLTINVPLIGGWLRRKAAEELIKDGSPESAKLLAETVIYGRRRNIQPVIDVLRQFDDPKCINAVCSIWHQTRNWHSQYYNFNALQNLILEQRWVAAAPISLQVLTALLNCRREQVTGLGARVVKPLVEACKDGSDVIAREAKQALRELTSAAAKEALCGIYIEDENPDVREAVMALGCEPKDESRKALFYFLLEQWDKYETIDFDHRRLRVIYETAEADLRQRIADRLRKAGKPDYLTIAVGGDSKSRASEMTRTEADMLVEAVAKNREWGKLWDLVFDVPFSSSIHALQILIESGWEPDGDDRETFKELASYAVGDNVSEMQNVDSTVSPAVRRARIRVPGRVNSVALSPAQPVIAVGTGQGKVVLWNYRRAVRERVLSGFDHSIGHLAFTGNGGLICAERSITNDEICTVYGWLGDKVFRLGAHKGPVTCVTAIHDSLGISTGRDGRVVMWDLNERRAVREKSYGNWIRDICISPDGKTAALQHQGIHLVTLPELEVVASRSWKQGQVVKNSVFTPDGEGIIAEKWGLKLWTKKGDTFRYEDITLGEDIVDYYGGRMLLMPNLPIIITAKSQGQITFVSWETRSPIGSVRVPVESLTSLNVSADGMLMAVGDSDASMTLWDLRPLGLPSMLLRTFNQLGPEDLKSIATFASDKALPEVTRKSLLYASCILRHRFRFDVQIDDSPIIQAGDFDIEVE